MCGVGGGGERSCGVERVSISMSLLRREVKYPSGTVGGARHGVRAGEGGVNGGAVCAEEEVVGGGAPRTPEEWGRSGSCLEGGEIVSVGAGLRGCGRSARSCGRLIFR